MRTMREGEIEREADSDAAAFSDTYHISLSLCLLRSAPLSRSLSLCLQLGAAILGIVISTGRCMRIEGGVEYWHTVHDTCYITCAICSPPLALSFDVHRRDDAHRLGDDGMELTESSHNEPIGRTHICE
jgi:hypothetical protein